MMKIIYIVGLILIYFTSFSQDGKITFPVSKVDVANELLKEIDYKSALQTRTNSIIESYPLAEKEKKLIATNAHAFISALHIGFAQHRPVVISPDMIWLLITQGVAIHIEKNNKVLKNGIVNFKGKKQLIIRKDDFVKGNEKNDWASVFPQFSDSIRKYINDSLYNLFVPTFSTTTNKEKNAYEIAFMSAVNSYFDYSTYTFCGIPEITLEGITSDWIWIANNCSNLEKIGLKDWSDNLKPILNEFVNASRGEIDTIFWQSMYKWCGISGGPIITGWIIKFFPYINIDNKLAENPFIKGNRFAYGGLRANNFPSGLSKVDMNWQYFSYNYNMELYSGFMGVAQNETTKALRPEISWVIKDYKSKVLNENMIIITDTFSLNDTIEKIRYYTKKNKNDNLLDTLKLPYDTWDIETYIFNKYRVNLHRLPNIFPEKCNNYKESVKELNNYISKKLLNNRIKYKGKISLVVTWYGKIDKVSIIESNKPQYDKNIISIIENISDCTPGIYRNKLVNIEINVELDVK